MQTYQPNTDFRKTMAKFATGLTVISTPEHKGFTCSAFISISLEPQLVAFTAMDTSTTFPFVEKHQIFGVSILSAHQQSLVYRFADSKITERFKETDHFETNHGVPILSDGEAWLVCEVYSIQKLGDHHMVVGNVLEHGISDKHDPILFYESKTRSLAEPTSR